MTALLVDGNKSCRGCGVEKPVDDFYRNRSAKDGRQSRCKGCANKATLASRANNAERQREYDRTYYRKHKHTKVRAYNLMKLYGIIVEQYEAKLAEQGGNCALCGNPPSKEGRGNRGVLHVDHDHKTGKIRDLLCGNCNTGLGWWDESPERLRLAAAYLERHR